MNSPEVVVFDLGKVLLDFDYAIAARNLSPKSKLDAGEFLRVLLQTPPLLHYETGLIAVEEFHSQVVTATGYAGSFAEFGPVFGDIFTPIDEMIELQGLLKSRRVPTFIFSNTNSLAVDHIRVHYPFFNGFTDYVLSYEHRSMKPDAKIYEVVEATTRRDGSRILYIDDRPENIAAGAARGWHAVLHETPAKSRQAVRDAGLLG